MSQEFDRHFALFKENYERKEIVDFFMKDQKSFLLTLIDRLNANTQDLTEETLTNIRLLVSLAISYPPDDNAFEVEFEIAMIKAFNAFIQKSNLQLKSAEPHQNLIYDILYRFVDWLYLRGNYINYLQNKREKLIEYLDNIAIMCSFKYGEKSFGLSSGMHYASYLLFDFDKEWIDKYSPYFLNHFDPAVVDQFKENMEDNDYPIK